MEAQRKRSMGSMHFLLQGPVCWPCSPLCLILPALTLNSLGTVSFGVARPRKESRPQPSSMARTEEKSPSTLRTWSHSEHSVRFRPATRFLLHPFPCIYRAHKKRGNTHPRGEEAACLYMLEGHGQEEGGKKEEEGEEGDVWDCMTAGATRAASPPGTLRWGQQGGIDQA